LLSCRGRLSGDKEKQVKAAPDVRTAAERIPFARTSIAAEAREAVLKVLESGWVTTGPEVGEFEREFAGFVGAEHAVAVASCTAAIELALRSFHLPRGAKVLVSTMTFCGAVNAILHAGYRPVLCDVDPDTLMPDPATTGAATRNAGGVDAALVLHFAGHPAPVAEIAEAARLPLGRVVEDAAHALGTSVGERSVGAISAATCFSFYATKNLPIGEGGMVTTNDPELADYIARCRLHGMSRDAWKRHLPGSGWRYVVETAGLKANMTDVQAAIGRAQLQHFSGWQARRETLAARYDHGLRAIDGVVPPARPVTGRHAWHLYVVRVQPRFGLNRDRFIAALAERGIDCSVHFIPLHQQPYLRKLSDDESLGFPAADEVFEEIVTLPLYPSLTEEEVDRVCGAIGDMRDGARLVANGDGRSRSLSEGGSP
jgi:dTDP-4-amino-4,6-dideoxygalactose transaminase